MQPIISPWIFYIIDMLPKLSGITFLMCLLGLVGFLIALMQDVVVSYNDGAGWKERIDPAKQKLKTRLLYTTGIISFIGFVGMILIPSQDTAYKMLIASYITPDNINAVVDGTGALVDRGVSYIGEISKSGLQTLMQSIVETARELKNL